MRTHFEDKSLTQKIKDRIAELKSDERLSYHPATVFSNAPLALIQASRMAQLNQLEELLGLEKSTYKSLRKDNPKMT